MSLLGIVGNIKQQYVPFVLNPNSGLNKPCIQNSDIRNGVSSDGKSGLEMLGDSVVSQLAGQKGQTYGAQYFSFRSKDKNRYNSGFGLLNVCPSSLREVDFGNCFSQDVSYKTLFNEMDANSGKNNGKSIDVNSLFNAMPGVQIREYLPDTKLDQCLNFMTDIIADVVAYGIGGNSVAGKAAKKVVKGLFGSKTRAGITTVFAGAAAAYGAYKSGLFEKLKEPNALAKIWASLKYVGEWLACMETANGKNLLMLGPDKPRFKLPGNDNSVYMPHKGGILDLNTYILTLPFTLYYRIQSCTTTNVYELPCVIEDAYKTNGKAGWDVGKFDFGNDYIGKIPLIGKMVQNMFDNVRIHYVPFWDSTRGSETKAPDVTVKFDLFNDTSERAMHNFIFVNTIIPNNMWLQYGLFQHSSNLYDIKVEGHQRLFACSGDFSVKYKGVLRDPPPSWIDYLCAHHSNPNINIAALKAQIKDNRLIKIPDIYEVTLNFESLLPQNFNTYLFQYSQNSKIDEEYTTGNIRQESIYNQFTSLPKQCINDLMDYQNSDEYKKEVSGKKEEVE